MKSSSACVAQKAHGRSSMSWGLLRGRVPWTKACEAARCWSLLPPTARGPSSPGSTPIRWWEKTVVDTANPYAARDGELATSIAASGGGSGSYTAHLLPGAHVVKAFNTVYWMDLRDQANRQGELLAMPIAGDDGLAVELATQLAQSAGFEPVLVGALARSAELDPGSPIYAKSMTAAQVRSTLKISSDSNK